MDHVADLWTVQITVTTPNGWQTFIRNLAYALTSHDDIARLVYAAMPQATSIISVTYLSWPGLPAHYPAAPAATPERVNRLRSIGHGGSVMS